jgi:hypothetical protein
VLGFTRRPEFVPGATYRLLQASGNRVGMYHLIRAGARLDSEFFPESRLWVDFPDTGAYSAMLTRRHVDYVVDCVDFDGYFATNEHALLDRLAANDADPGDAGQLRTRLVSRTPGYSVYEVLRPGDAPRQP